ncbi:glycosyltransferase family 4 protein [Limnochorda pilosa]|uniref:Glycosyltransferase subfamily 4-like N-terminal domain-containing protein n=1 Tax=Limnochorda pilosa TaxID=1555112 RepID=A0A0K2SGB4_LIMPI|nr:glycosyltransferase family 4 protein [Limnochorda pilosa]BAS25879.1 hypothetical protein LIP_0019 [Limnochorda pilosa]
MLVLQVVGQAAGGVLRHLRQLVDGLEDHRFIVAGPAAVVQSFERLPNVLGVWPLPTGGGLNPVGDWRARQRLRLALDASGAPGIDLVHVHGWRAGAAAVDEVCRHAPVVWTVHTQPPEGAVARWRIGRVLGRLGPAPVQMIAVSRSLAAEVERAWPKGGARVWAVRNGLSPQDLEALAKLTRSGRERVRQHWARRGLGAPAAARAPERSWNPRADLPAPAVELPFPVPVLGFMGRIWGPKGIFDAVETLAALVRAGWPAVLEVAGEGPDEAAARRLARQQGVGERVAFLGWRQPSEFLSRIDLLLHPSRSEGGVPYTVMEAMAAGVPVVASRLPPLDEVVAEWDERSGRSAALGAPGGEFRATETGLLSLARPGDPADLARATAACLNDPEATARRAQAARRYVRLHLGSEATLDLTDRIYRVALAGPGAESEAPTGFLKPDPGLAGSGARGYNLRQTQNVREDGDQYPS